METKTVLFNVSGMSCGSCVAKIENAFKEFDGIDKISIDLNNKKAKFKLSDRDKISNEEIINTINKAGFEASVAS